MKTHRGGASGATPRQNALDPSAGNKPEQGDTNIQATANPRTHKRQWDGFQVKRRQELAPFQLSPIAAARRAKLQMIGALHDRAELEQPQKSRSRLGLRQPASPLWLCRRRRSIGGVGAPLTSTKAPEDWEHSTTWRSYNGPGRRASVLDCGSPLPLCRRGRSIGGVAETTEPHPEEIRDPAREGLTFHPPARKDLGRRLGLVESCIVMTIALILDCY